MALADYAAADSRWDHTASILAMLANTVRDTKKHPRAYSPAKFHPLRQRKEHDSGPGDLSLIREVLKSCQRPPVQ